MATWSRFFYQRTWLIEVSGKILYVCCLFLPVRQKNTVRMLDERLNRIVLVLFVIYNPLKTKVTHNIWSWHEARWKRLLTWPLSLCPLMLFHLNSFHTADSDIMPIYYIFIWPINLRLWSDVILWFQHFHTHVTLEKHQNKFHFHFSFLTSFSHGSPVSRVVD